MAQAHGKPIGLMVQMTCFWAQYTGEIITSTEIEEVRWLNYKDKPLVSFVDQLIFDDLNQIGLLS